MSTRNIAPRTQKQHLAQERAFAALAVMRRENISLALASKLTRTDPATVRTYVGSALVRKGKRGQYHAKPYDRIPRVLNFHTPERLVAVTVKSSRTATLIADYNNAVKRYLHSADESALKRFRGKTFRSGNQTYQFATDLAKLRELAGSGFHEDRLYRSIAGVTL